MADNNKKQGLRNTAGPTFMSSQRLRQHAKGLQRSVPNGITVLRGSEHNSPSLTRKLSRIDNYLQGKNWFSPRESKPHLRAGAKPSSRWPTKWELSGIFGGVLSHDALSGHFFFLLYVLWFLTWCFYGISVCACVGRWRDSPTHLPIDGRGVKFLWMQ